MKHCLLLLIFVATAFVQGFSQTIVPLEQAEKFIGDTVRICSKVISSQAAEEDVEQPTHLVLGEKNTRTLTVVIPADARKWFDYKPGKDLLTRKICVSGKLESVDGKLRMVVTKQENINIAD